MAKKTTAPELSHSDVRQLLIGSIRDAEPRKTSLYIEDVYEGSVVYCDYDEGGTYRRDYTIGEGNTVTLGDPSEVIKRTVYEDVVQMAAFSIEAGPDAGGMVPWRGPIFRAGSYPDKGMTLSESDLDAAVSAFKPVRLNVEHKGSVFSGKFGDLTRVWREGSELRGELSTPKWFRDDVASDGKLSVSTEWDVATKQLVGLATSLSPRVTGAEVVAVFSEAEAHFAGRRNSARDQSTVQAIHDHAAKLGAECAGAKAKMGQEVPPMSEQKKTLLERFTSMFSAEEATALGLATTPPAVPPVPVAPQPVAPSVPVAEMATDDRAELERFRAESKAGRKAKIPTEAAAFAEGLVTAGKATPADRQILIARFTEAAEDDVDAPRPVTFSVGGEQKTGTRVERLTAEFAAAPGHGLFTEAVPRPDAVVLMGTGTNGLTGEAAMLKAAEDNAAAYADRHYARPQAVK